MSPTVPTKPEFFLSSAELAAWFAANPSATEVWVGFWKKGFERPGISYADAVDEALCEGWIDSVIRRVDEASYMLRFTPRRARSSWTDTNLRRVEALRAAERMRTGGERAVAAARVPRSGQSTEPPYTRRAMAVMVRVPGPLRRLTNGSAEVSVEGGTVGQVLTNLDSAYPGFHDRLYDDAGSLRQFINIYVNDSDIRFAQGLDTPIAERDEVSIVPAVAGGRIRP